MSVLFLQCRRSVCGQGTVSEVIVAATKRLTPGSGQNSTHDRDGQGQMRVGTQIRLSAGLSFPYSDW